jgi:hypothetical protein
MPLSDPILFGHKGLDALMGAGGLRRGAFTEISGPPQSGKTILMLAMVASVQRSGGVVAWVDSDATFDPRLAALCGVSFKDMLYIPSAPAEAIFDVAAALAGQADLVVIDPLSALSSEAEIAQKGFSEDLSKTHFRAVSNGLRTLFSAAALSQTAVLLVSQQRWHPQRGIIAGTAEDDLAYYATVRLSSEILRREAGGGSWHSLKLSRSVSHPEDEGMKASFFFDPEAGLDLAESPIDLAFRRGLITVNDRGGWVLPGWGAQSSREEWMARLRNEPGLRQDIETRLEAATLL